MRYRPWFAMALLGLFIAATVIVGHGQEAYPDPHWGKDKKSCLYCHASIPKDASNLNLKFGGDYITLCNSCHEVVSKDKYIHAVAMVMPEGQIDRMPEDFKKAVLKDKDKRLTCIVCHELKYQCLPSEFYRRETNPRFFRGGPYALRSDLCWHCHDRSQYERLNPHDQITDEGDLIEDRCLYCHETTPDRRKVKSIKDVKFKVDEELNRLCTRCHAKEIDKVGCIVGTDSSGRPLDHHVKPSKEVLSKMKDAKDYIIPLEPSTGKIFCGTCHNPHEIGVQRLPKADRGADVHGRLRMGAGEKCVPCHGVDFKPVAPILPVKHPKMNIQTTIKP